MSHEARNLQWLLQSFVEEVPGVRSVAVVSSDGLPLISSHSAASAAGQDASAAGRADPALPAPRRTPGKAAGTNRGDLAAVVSGLASLTVGAAKLMDGGRVRQTTVAMADGALFVMSISDGSLLGVHAGPDCDMSVIAYHMALFVGRAGHVLTPALRTELRHALESAR
ncbi:roadblock/LC7 domain-containing protein [Actinacidiphila alni]|uniref:roadblock/LC7 domain-containing protein n=1 Tax=Actinacidiphila alni TaxID=380248 RepID=UPI003454737F